MKPLGELTKRVQIFNPEKMTKLGVYNEEEFHALLARECFRSTRSGQVFSVVCFEIKGQKDDQELEAFVNCLKKEIRSTDEIGWFDGESLGVFLYDTSRQGAACFIEKVKKKQGELGECKIHTYPSEWLNAEKKGATKEAPGGRGLPAGGPGQGGERKKAVRRETFQRPYVLPVWKRSLDLCIALTGLVLLSPVFLLVALFIKLVSPGPVFFKQERIGYNGKPFTFWKFRTMDVAVDTSGHRNQMAELIRGQHTDKPMTKQDNPCIIPLGKLLRNTCIDEIPQLINVVRGEMSLVGPRPPIPYEVQEYHHWHKERFNALPGLTGLWQVSGKNRLTFNEMIRLDINYIRRISPWLDLKILLLTPKAILSNGK